MDDDPYDPMHAVDASSQTLDLADALAALAASSGPAGAGHGRGRSRRNAALAARLPPIPETTWSPRVRHAAWRLAQGQRFALLAVHGIDASALPEPPRAADGAVAVRAVFCRDQQIVVAFSFDRELDQAMLALPNRRYDRERRGWTLPASPPSAEAPAGPLSAHPGSTVEPATAEPLRDVLSGEQAGPPARSAEPAGRAAFRLILPAPAPRRDRGLLPALRDWDAACFYRAGRGRDAHWRINLRDHDAQSNCGPKTCVADFFTSSRRSFPPRPERPGYSLKAPSVGVARLGRKQAFALLWGTARATPSRSAARSCPLAQLVATPRGAAAVAAELGDTPSRDRWLAQEWD